MSDYIKREDALDAWYEKERYNDIEAIPAADVVERKHGEWENFTRGVNYDWGNCSCCGIRVGMLFDFNYCPVCGAEMESADDV